MFEILVLSQRAENPVTAALKSLNSKCEIAEKAIPEMAGEVDASQMKCVALCFHAEETDQSLSERCEQLEEFLEKNNLVNTPVMPIMYGVDPDDKFIIGQKLNQLIDDHQSLNFLRDGLIWGNEETSEEFILKLKNTLYVSGYTVSTNSDDEYDISGKNISIAKLVASILGIVLGLILGPIAGGLIGGLTGGGLIGGLVGAGIGLVLGPIVLTLIANGVVDLTQKNIENERTDNLQQLRELGQRNDLWGIFKASFFPQGSQSLMAPLFTLPSSGPSSDIHKDESTLEQLPPKKKLPIILEFGGEKDLKTKDPETKGPEVSRFVL